jgi:hypothetical protein
MQKRIARIAISLAMAFCHVTCIRNAQSDFINIIKSSAGLVHFTNETKERFIFGSAGQLAITITTEAEFRLLAMSWSVEPDSTIEIKDAEGSLREQLRLISARGSVLTLDRTFYFLDGSKIIKRQEWIIQR